ncbi:MAG: hypothetical protein HY822_21980 [Acidobacteria bacterium]|nr:hypothetical protein [Acidobacteriota bacterium]
MTRIASVVCCLCLAFLAVVPARATILTYSSLGDWQAIATQSGATIDFSSFTAHTSAMTSWTDAASGAVFSAPGTWVQGIFPSGSTPWYEWGSGAFLRVTDGGFAMRIALAAPVSALAAEMMIYKESSPGVFTTSQMTVTYGAGATILGTSVVSMAAKPVRTFFGLVSDDSNGKSDWYQIQPAYNYAMVDNVRLGSYLAPAPPPPDPEPDPSPVPEPGTLLLGACGAALLLLGGVRAGGRKSG